MEFLEFSAFDYHRDDTFTRSTYRVEGSERDGWEILRNGESYLTLGKGYRLLKTELCGVCSTDLDRRFLPFPLPQVIGHEVIASDPETGKKFALEINDTATARGEGPDIFARRGLFTHSPDRQVLGIDRLLGGFGPYVLAPIGTMVEIGSLSDSEAVLLEPFSASFHAVETSLQRLGSNPKRIAVLGPRRLGSLLIGALDLYRRNHGSDFSISSVVKREALKDISFSAGADEVFVFDGLDSGTSPDLSGKKFLKKGISESLRWMDLKNEFDLVFDTTGAVRGLEVSMELTPMAIHRKTTNGQASLGIKNLTELVVDELTIAPLREDFWNLCWGIRPSDRQVWVFLEEKVILSSAEELLLAKAREKGIRFFSGSLTAATNFSASPEFTGDLGRFDFAIVSSLSAIDSVIRPGKADGPSLLRPRGSILVPRMNETQDRFMDWIGNGGNLQSSRCGDFRRTLSALDSQPGFLMGLSRLLIAAEFSGEEVPEAYVEARKPDSIKVVVRHGSYGPTNPSSSRRENF
ncbi:zinc-binding alcohol dehydrogenase [Leptospira fluminis]|uniref:Zinc-binding alcohol dehydrogenase n=1 Tax=Leptospira fluminis TaxID=2484979 RepID=A0A4R9GSQ7_9LEPT|nr:alcohol dehydrogenase catalytic domain-containing protein [Leptospira fluminis]TGK21238.1 zinc-binding alcohol dehydrogenase [Leptospira fluminis]